MTPLRSRAAALAAALLLLPFAACDDQQPPPAPRLREEAVTTAPAPDDPVTLRFRPAAYGGWLDAIPDGLDLGAGRGSHRPASWTLCGSDVFRVGDVVDRRTVRMTLGARDTETRDLRLFVDDRAADAYQRGVLRAARGCRAELSSVTSPGKGWLRLATDRGTRATWSDVVRVGNAVLTTLARAPYADAMGRQDPVARHHHVLQGVVDQMCVFTADGCEMADPDIPADFPLAAGFPDPDWAEGPGAGLAGPSRALPAPVWELCGSTLALPKVRDRMAAQWSNPEDYRSRQLVTFADTDQASAFLGRLTDFFRSCPQQSTGTDFVGFQHVEPREVGDEADVLYRVQEYQGSPGLGVEISQATRVGRAVLVDVVSNEGDARGVPDQLQHMTRASAAIVRAMCVYADSRCAVPAGSLTLGPDGVGDLRLGLRAPQLRSLGIHLEPAGNGTGCSVFTARVDGHRVGGDYDPRIGVSMLNGEGLVTPEGVGPGTPLWRADASYVDGDAGDGQLFVPHTPGRPDRSYRMEAVRGRVTSLVLLADDQHCAS